MERYLSKMTRTTYDAAARPCIRAHYQCSFDTLRSKGAVSIRGQIRGTTEPEDLAVQSELDDLERSEVYKPS